MMGWAPARSIAICCFNEVTCLVKTKSKTTNPQVIVPFKWLSRGPCFLRCLNDLLTRSFVCAENFDDCWRLGKGLQILLK